MAGLVEDFLSHGINFWDRMECIQRFHAVRVPGIVPGGCNLILSQSSSSYLVPAFIDGLARLIKSQVLQIRQGDLPGNTYHQWSFVLSSAALFRIQRERKKERETERERNFFCACVSVRVEFIF